MLRLNRGGFLIMHLGMTGDVKYYRREAPPNARIILTFNNGFKMAYISQRMLQGVWLKGDPGDLPAIMHMGPEPLDPDLSLSDFAARLKGRRASLKALLMDQSFIAGLGNIYADEVLFQCGISPARTTALLKDREMERIFHEMRRTLASVCEVSANWERLNGIYLAPHRVAGGPCPRCGAALRRLRIAGRSSYFCPRCQR